MCGFNHSTFEIVPVTLTGFVASYSADSAWCAKIGATNIKTVRDANRGRCRLIKCPPVYFSNTTNSRKPFLVCQEQRSRNQAVGQPVVGILTLSVGSIVLNL